MTLTTWSDFHLRLLGIDDAFRDRMDITTDILFGLCSCRLHLNRG